LKFDTWGYELKAVGKGVPVLSKHHTMKTYGGMEVQLHACLTMALDRREWSASQPSHFTPRERAPCTYQIGDWEAPRACLYVMVNRKESVSLPGIKP